MLTSLQLRYLIRTLYLNLRKSFLFFHPHFSLRSFLDNNIRREQTQFQNNCKFQSCAVKIIINKSVGRFKKKKKARLSNYLIVFRYLSLQIRCIVFYTVNTDTYFVCDTYVRAAFSLIGVLLCFVSLGSCTYTTLLSRRRRENKVHRRSVG